jgi:mRNA interferase HigB
MHVISRKALREFWASHPPARGPLLAWFRIARVARWQTFAEVRAVYPSADQVGRFTVFNIGGNKYRLIAVIHFNRRKLYIRQVLTHEEYDSGNGKEA